MDTGFSHETRHALSADAHALLNEFGMPPGQAVRFLGILVNLADALAHHRVGDAALGRSPLKTWQTSVPP